MFKHILLRSLAGAAAVGSALAVSVAATPAVVTSATEIANVACTIKYPSSVATTTTMSLSRSGGVFGSRNRATATVSSGATGKVRITLAKSGTTIDSWTVALDAGKASVVLPRRLPARATYSVRAKYLPGSCSVFKSSTSGSAYYTVAQASTQTAVNAPGIRRGKVAKAYVSVSSNSPLAANGKVRVVLTRRGNQVASDTYTLQGGSVTASFGRLRVGGYSVTAYYKGTNNYRASKGADDFRVRR